NLPSSSVGSQTSSNNSNGLLSAAWKQHRRGNMSTRSSSPCHPDRPLSLTQSHTYTHTRTYIHPYTHTHRHTPTHTYTYIHPYTHTDPHTHTHTYTYNLSA